tara:strand:+ start:1305 stop:1832 length:528 start_codon:yes stop_codon:yes gene_type:complete
MLEEVLINKQSFFKTKYMGNLEIIDKHINHILEFDQGRQISNIGGYQSNFINFGFEELINFTTIAISKILEKDNLQPNLDCFWLNINSGTNHNVGHIHGFNLMSCVYYHKVCCDKSPLVFTSMVPAVEPYEKIFIPNNQDLIFFNGIYPHRVDGCGHNDHQRISIALNYNLKEKQ